MFVFFLSDELSRTAKHLSIANYYSFFVFSAFFSVFFFLETRFCEIGCKNTFDSSGTKVVYTFIWVYYNYKLSNFMDEVQVNTRRCFSFFFLWTWICMVIKNSDPGKFANIWQTARDGIIWIIELIFETTRIHFNFEWRFLCHFRCGCLRSQLCKNDPTMKLGNLCKKSCRSHIKPPYSF